MHDYYCLSAGSEEEFQGDYSLFRSLALFKNLHLCSVCIFFFLQLPPYKFYQIPNFIRNVV